jgi:hypothetical protein
MFDGSLNSLDALIELEMGDCDVPGHQIDVTTDISDDPVSITWSGVTPTSIDSSLGSSFTAPGAGVMSFSGSMTDASAGNVSVVGNVSWDTPGSYTLGSFFYGASAGDQFFGSGCP